jgi:paraquat-inducible protein B
MSESAHPSALVRSRSDKRRRVSLIWGIPIVTLLIAAWLVWDTLSKRGPTIVISFDTAEGLQAGQSHVKHKDVDMGLVSSVALSRDLQHVDVTVQMNREAEPLLTDKTRFWVVKPRLFAGSISGISTLISGSYIELLPSAVGGVKQRRFTGLEDPPVLQSAVPGSTFMLKAKQLGSVSLGSPVFYRDLSVGEVLGWDLGDMAQSVTIHAFIRHPFDTYVHEGSRFWNASGLSVQLSGTGVDVQLESLKALLLGGVAFETPAEALKTAVSADGQDFPLYADRDAARKAGFQLRIPFLAYFDGSVTGLAPGSPVNLHGIRVGEVTSVDLHFDPQTQKIQVPVRFEVEPERMVGGRSGKFGDFAGLAKIMSERHTRAQLATVNMLTGAMAVTLDNYPDAPPDETRVVDGVMLIPTTPGEFADLSKSVSDIMRKLNQMPFTQIGKNLDDMLHGLNDLTNGPELRQALAALQASLVGAQDMVKRMDAGVGPAAKKLPEIASGLQETLTHANKLLGSAETGYGDNSKFLRDTDRAMLQLNDAAQSIRMLADILSRHPEALVRGRADTGRE